MNRFSPIFLAGGMKQFLLQRQTGLHPLQMPIKPGLENLVAWGNLLDNLDVTWPAQVVCSSLKGLRQLQFSQADSRFSFVIEPHGHRGTAGVLADLWSFERKVKDSSEFILMVEGSCCPPSDLSRLFESPILDSADVIFGTVKDDQLSGVCLVRKSTLRHVPMVGYFDLKEQLVKSIINQGGTVVSVQVGEQLQRLTDFSDWTRIIRQFSGSKGGQSLDQRSQIQGACCISPSATIGEGVGIIDSVIMPRAVIGDHSIVARSFVEEGIKVPNGTRIIDSFFTAASVRSRMKR